MLTRYGEDAYPIGRLILQRATALGISRTELVRRCGYSNLSGGHRALDSLLATGKLSPLIAHHLPNALGTEASLIEEALVRTRFQQAEEEIAERRAAERRYYADFQPYLRAETEHHVPEPIHVAALCGTVAMRIVPVPKTVWEADTSTRDRLVRNAIRLHWRQRKGMVPTFGEIIAYALVLAPGVFCDLALPYDVDGARAGPMRSVRRLGTAVLLIKDKPILGSAITLRPENTTRQVVPSIASFSPRRLDKRGQ